MTQGAAENPSGRSAAAGADSGLRDNLRSLARRLEVAPAEDRAAKPLLYGLAVLFVVLVVLIPVIGTNAQRLLVQQALYLGLLALSLRLLVSTTGLISFGHAMFFAVGAYLVGLTFVHLDWAPLLSLALSPVVGAAFAVLVGLIVLRGRELYFALLTLGVAQLVWAVAHSWRSVTGGGDGTTGVFAAEWLNPFAEPDNLYWFILAVVAVCAVVLYIVTASPFGDTLRGIRENRSRAEFSGLWVKRHELLAFVIAGSIGAVAGALHVIGETQIESGQVTWERSAIALIAILLGGTRYFLGPFVGAFFYIFLVDFLVGRTDLWQLVVGIVVLFVALAPVGGLTGVVHWLLAQALRIVRRLGIGGAAPMPAAAASGDREQTHLADAAMSRAEPAKPDGREQGPPILELRHLRKSFGGLVATDDVDLSVAEGNIHAVIGPNGAGKTTLFNQITGLIPPDDGEVILDGENVTGKPPWRVIKRGLGRSFQQPNLFWELPVLSNVVVPMSVASGGSLKLYGGQPEAIREQAATLLDQVGLGSLAEVPVTELSHGDRRTLEIASVLALGSRVLLLDEPTAGLSPAETKTAVALIQAIAREHNLTVLFVEHDMDVVFGIADRVTVLVDGTVLAEGTPTEIRNSPEVRRAYLGETEDESGQVVR